MELNALQCFLATANCLNFTKAANELYISQPTLSYHISNLEQEFGALLFDRKKKQIRLTEAGEILYAEAVAAFKHLDLAKEKISNLESARNTLRFGFLEMLITPCFYQFVDPFLKKFPMMPSLMERRGTSIINGLAEVNQYDFVFTRGLARIDRDTPPGLAFKTLIRDTISLILPDRPPYSDMDGINDLSDLQEDQLLIVDTAISGNMFFGPLNDILKERGYLLRKTPRAVANIDDLLTQIVAGQGFGILPTYNSIELTRRGMKLIPLENDTSGYANVVLAWNPNHMNSKNRLYLDYLNEHFEGEITYSE